MDEQGTWYRIEQVAARTGLTKRTIRYYEEIGLLPSLARTEGNYRVYSEQDVIRLERIVQIKEALGLTLAETSAMLAVEEEREGLRAAFWESDTIAERLVQIDRAELLTQQQIDLVQRKMQTLAELLKSLEERMMRYQQRRAEMQDQHLHKDM